MINHDTHTRFKSALLIALLIACFAATTGAQNKAQPPRRQIHIFLDLKETNLDQPSTVAVNTLAERITGAGFRVTTNRREAALIVEGSINSRQTPVTDEVKREGGVNAEASASVRLLVGNDVIATSVERSAPGDWGVQAERVGEDRLIEVAGLVADDLFNEAFVRELIGEVKQTGQPEKETSARSTPSIKPARKPAARPQSKRGVSFLEVVALVQNYTPEDRIVGALRKYGIKFKPRDSAINQLRGAGASEMLIAAIKTSNVV